MKYRSLIIFLALIFSQLINAQIQVDCSKLSLSADTFYLSHTQYTTVVADLNYLDTNMTVYPILHLILEDTSIITSPNNMVLSFLVYPIDTLETCSFPIYFKTTNYASNTVLNALFHIYDADTPGDSLVSCYFPIKLILQNPLSVIKRIPNSSEVTIYPNPIITLATIEFEKTNFGHLNFQLYDLNGKLVFSKREINEQKTQIELPELENGMYLYTLSGENGIEAKGKLALNKN